jgi:hypothetical protein
MRQETTFLLDTSIIAQPFSWGRFSLTESAFRKVVTSLRVFTPFINLVQAFGQKLSDEERFQDTVYEVVRGDPTLADEQPVYFGNATIPAVTTNK